MSSPARSRASRLDSDLSESIVDILAKSVAIQSRQQVINDLSSSLDVPVVGLSGPELTTTTPLNFIHTVALAEAAYTPSARLLRSLTGASELAAGLLWRPAARA